MLIKEYRICEPMTVEEYRIAQLYMIQKKSREETTGKESGVEILTNEPYTDGPGGSGQYTLKVYHVGSHLPGWLRSIIPDAALRVEEEAWNAYPYTKTRYRVPFVEKFTMEIETKYLDDGGDTNDVFDLTPEEREACEVDFIDIVTDPVAPSKPTDDPTTYISEVTGRGPLTKEWRAEFQKAMTSGEKYTRMGVKADRTGSMTTEPLPKRIMCSYKLCRVEFRYWGMQTKIEQFIHDIAIRRTMVNAHRQAWTWQDEWYGLTMSEIRALEAETAKALAAKIHEDNQNGGTKAPIDRNKQQLADADILHAKQNVSATLNTDASGLTFVSGMGFVPESERASSVAFQSVVNSDLDEDNDDFFDAQSILTSGPGANMAGDGLEVTSEGS